MGENLSPENRRKTMRAVKGKGTRLEKRLFSLLARTGMRGWKQNADEIVGKPDVAFVKRRIAIFVDGCFWHGCPQCQRKLPKTNRMYWKRKIERNISLAESYNRQLRAHGWLVIRIWEHELSGFGDRKMVEAKILRKLNSRTTSV